LHLGTTHALNAVAEMRPSTSGRMSDGCGFGAVVAVQFGLYRADRRSEGLTAALVKERPLDRGRSRDSVALRSRRDVPVASGEAKDGLRVGAMRGPTPRRGLIGRRARRTAALATLLALSVGLLSGSGTGPRAAVSFAARVSTPNVVGAAIPV